MHNEFSGTLTRQDVKKHVPHTCTLPSGATELRLHFTYSPGLVDDRFNALHLSLFDPNGFRGAGHRRGEVDQTGVSHTVVITSNEATPGYLPGPVTAGEWTVVIDTHMILPDVSITYSLVVETSNELLDEAPKFETLVDEKPVRSGGPGWYRGDLHGHTVHSDASWQTADLIAAAQTFQLDFATLSDHNTTSGLAEFERLAAPTVLPIAAQELTTYWGHALILGVRHWIDWRVRPGERTMPDIAAEVEAAGGLFIIAHPMSEGDPVCTGCDWSYKDMMPGPARFVEVWNGGEWNGDSHNENALALWYVWLNQGHRLVATAGTDVHGPAPEGVRPGFDLVYAEELSERAILQAVRQGHLFLSDGPRVTFTAQAANGAEAMMGDSLPEGDLMIHATWEGCAPTDEVRLIADGQPLATHIVGHQSQQQWTLAAGQARWYTLEIREPNGRLRVVTNPIFVGDASAVQ